MRKETRIGLIGFAIYVVLDLLIKENLNGIGGLWFINYIMGICMGLSLVGIGLGMLPDDAYNKLKLWKGKLKKRLWAN